MSIETRIQAINDHLIDDYKVLRLAGADLTGVNKNIVNLKMSWKERLLYFMNNGTQEVWDNWDKVSGTGTTLSLNNTEEASMSLTYKGNTSQNGTPTPTSPIPVQVVSGDNTINVVGKNLFSSALEEGSYEAGAKVAYAGFYRSTDKISIQPNTTYTLSINGVSQRYVLSFYNSSSTFISQDASLSNGTFTSVNNAYYITIRCFQTDYTSDYANLKIQLEKGNQATTYEAYQSASYPISLGDKELCKIGTYQDKIDKSSGKNLLNEEFTQMSANAIKCELLNFPSGTYTWSFSNNTLPGEIQVKTKVNGTYQTYVSAYSTNQLTFTLNTSQDIQLESYRAGGNPLSAYNQIMLNEGSTSLPYEPYGTSWYLKKEIGKVVLNGSEAWVNLNYAYYSTALNSLIKNIATTDQSIYVMADHFKGESAYQAGTQGTAGIYTVNTQLYLRGYNSTYADINALKTFLSSNNTIVYYVLATPTYETITDTTLIGQLEEAKKSYESQTNISQINNDLPFELSVTALEVMS